MANETQKPTKYYVDFENVHGAGLKGVAELDARDEVIIIYSQAAETFHIEHAIDIMKSQARIEFVEVDGGTRNAADFQLIVALYAHMSDEFDYAIVSGDTGFDAAIKMGERLGMPSVCRLGNIAGDEAEPEKPKSRRSRRGRGGRDAAKETAAEAPVRTAEQGDTDLAPTAAAGAAPAESPAEEEVAASVAAEDSAMLDSSAPASAEETVEAPTADQASDKKPSSSRRRSRRRKRNGSAEGQSDAQAGEVNAQDAADRDAGATSDDRPDAPPASDSATHAESATSGAQTDASPESDSPDTAALVKAFLEEKGIELPEAQIATVASALDGPDGRQGFYRRIIKIERQQSGRILYRQVREHYAALLQAIGK